MLPKTFENDLLPHMVYTHWFDSAIDKFLIERKDNAIKLDLY